MRKIVYATLIISALAFSSCTLPKMVKMAQEQELTVTPNPLEVHSDTVSYEMAVNLPVKMLKKGTVYTVNSYYTYGDNEIALDPVTFRAEDYPNAATVQPRVTQSFSFPYMEAYQTGMLQVEGVASKGTKTKVTPRMDVAPGLVTTSKLVQNAYYAAYAGHGYNNQEEIIPVVIPDFIFLQGSSVLRNSETSSAKGQQLNAFIASKNVTRSVTITGTHSPEGPERVNSELAPNRAAAIERYYRAQMDRYDYEGMADSINFIPKPIVRDWNEFKTALAAYDGLTADQKSAYLNIVNGSGTFEEQERQLQQLPTYRQVFNNIYPGLRTAKTEILTIKDKKTDTEISVLARQISQGSVDADTLSIEELMYSATLTPSLEEKAAIYDAATKKGTYWNAHNNLGATYIAMAIENPNTTTQNADRALAQLEIAARLQQSPEVNANLASVSLMQGNPYKAYDYASMALNGANSDVMRGVNGVKAATEIYMAEYAAAVRSASSAATNDVNLFNKGLAQLLNMDNANAATSFSEAISENGNNALAHYGAAIAAARQGNVNNVVSNLTNAVRVDPSLKEKALTDLEFVNFQTNEAFRNALM